MSDIDNDGDRDGSSPKIYLLPNLMTAGNLFCGFLAILMIFKGMRDPASGASDYKMAIALILGACLFDLLDGRVARLRGQESLFGREFDSLADIVSFGVAPALLVMDIVLNDFSERLGWITAFVYLLCGWDALGALQLHCGRSRRFFQQGFSGISDSSGGRSDCFDHRLFALAQPNTTKSWAIGNTVCWF